MNIQPGKVIARHARSFRPSLVEQLRNQLIAFAFGIVFGLLLALWWRAAQIHQAERDIAPRKYFKSESATLNQ